MEILIHKGDKDMPRPKKPIEERIQQTRDEIATYEKKLIELKELLKQQLAEKDEIEKQNLFDLVKKHNLDYDEIEKLIVKSQKK